MALTQKYKKLALHNENYELPQYREPGEPIRLIGEVRIDRSVFMKSKKEKEILKLAKIQYKIDSMKKRLFANK